MRVAYSAYPNWEAYSALGYVYGQRAGVPLKDIKPRKYAFADLAHAKKAAEFYDKATAIMEAEAPDWHHRRFMLWHALYWHLRAGGLSVREMRSRYNTAKQVSEEAERFFVEVNGVASYGEPRKFSEIQLDSINQNMRKPPPGVTDRSILKPIPTLNCRGLPRSINYQQLLDREEFERLPGDVDAIDVLG
ncbi:TPR_REGION domain-containing protein [Rhodotorula toruloides]|nr:TPR_REGION domain-containing protein [Rhodotorula toruloides]